MMTHAEILALYEDWTLEKLIADLRSKNLRDYRDHETRHLAERAKAATAELKKRKAKRK